MTDKFIPSTQFIEKLPDICVDLELVSVYDMDCYSVPQLLYRLAQKINDTITNMEHNDSALKAQLNDLQVKLEYLLGEGLTEELTKIFEKMYADGSLQALVQGAIVDINKRIDDIKAYIDMSLETIVNDNNKKELLYKGNFNSLKDLLENGENVEERGGIIHIPSGIYELEPFTLGNRIKLKGSGIGATILKQKSGTIGDFITIDKDNSFCTITDLTIYGNKENCPNAQHCVSIKGLNTNNNHDENYVINKTIKKEDTYAYFKMENVIIKNAKYSGINIEENRYAIYLNNIHVVNCDDFGITSNSTDNFFTNIYLENNGNSGLFESGANNKWLNVKSIWNCKTKNTLGAIYLNCSRCSFVNVEAQDNYSHGFNIYGKGGNKFIGCLSDANGYKTYTESSNIHHGFLIDRTSNNVFKGCKVDSYRGIEFMVRPYLVVENSQNIIDISYTKGSCQLEPIGLNCGGTNGKINNIRYTIEESGIKHMYFDVFLENTNNFTSDIELPLQNIVAVYSIVSNCNKINNQEIPNCGKLQNIYNVVTTVNGKQVLRTQMHDIDVAGTNNVNVQVHLICE